MGTYRGGYVYRGSLALVELNAGIVAERAERAEAARASRFTDCGTPAAYKRHRKLREAPCAACRKAAREDRPSGAARRRAGKAA